MTPAAAGFKWLILKESRAAERRFRQFGHGAPFRRKRPPFAPLRLRSGQDSGGPFGPAQDRRIPVSTMSNLPPVSGAAACGQGSHSSGDRGIC